MKKVDVTEVVTIPGAFKGLGGNMLHVEVKLSFDIPPILYSPAMAQVVLGELQNTMNRLLEQAKKEMLDG